MSRAQAMARLGALLTVILVGAYEWNGWVGVQLVAGFFVGLLLHLWLNRDQLHRD